MSELRDRLNVLAGKLARFAKVLDLDAKLAEIAKTEARMADGDFWTDQGRAQATVATLKSLRGVVDPYLALDRAGKDSAEMLDLAEADKDEATLAELSSEVDRIADQYERLELRLALSGKYDRAEVVYMTIKPGAGGIESCDWAEMLFRMYSAFCARLGWRCETLDMLPGENAGLKDCTIAITGENAYGLLKSEMGTHRLVRISPFDGNARRQTSFAAVEITPEIDEVDDVLLDEKELRIDTYRASGAGGQHVNKTDSAVRITHIPSGLFVAVQTERSQVQNKARAMKMLTAKLQQVREAERLDELKDLMSERGTIGWGHQIRSYVMMPYQMVKDLRTRHETSRVQDVLDGDVQPFVDAYLRWCLAGRPDLRGQNDEE